MQSSNLPAPSHLIIIVLVIPALGLGACRNTEPPNTKTDPAIQTTAAPDPKVAVERPLLAARIENISMYPVPNRRGDLAVSLVVSVHNSGSPGIARNWSLEVNSSKLRVPTVVEPVHVNGSVVMPGTSGEKVDLAKEDLVLKTAEAAIAKDGGVNGILTFVLPKTSESDLANANASFILHFKDTESNQYKTASAVIGGKVKRPGISR